MATPLNRVRPRRGISLMEVLIAMFVAMVGLLGVAAMIPLGYHEINQGSRADYASSLGRAAYRNFKVRRALQPPSWCDLSTDPNLGRTILFPDSTTGLPKYRFGNIQQDTMFPIVFDPIGLARGLPNYFPAGAGNIPPGLPRATFAAGFSKEVREASAREMFLGHDDLTFVLPEDGDLPPSQFFSPSNGLARRVSQDEYSWLVTLVPVQANRQELPATHGNTQIMVTMSIVVFYQRNPVDPTLEQAVPITAFPGGGVGGGDVTLGANVDVLPGQWIMLAGALPAPDNRAFYKWYRVVASEEPDEGAGERHITLAGPDWPTATLQSGPAAWIVDGVIAVYEKNLRLEGPSIWSN